MHIIDCSVEPILSGWITGRSNVIEPIGLSTVLSTGVNAVLVNETSCNDKLDNYGSTITSSTGRVAQNDSCGCFGGCVGFGSGGSVTLDLSVAVSLAAAAVPSMATESGTAAGKKYSENGRRRSEIGGETVTMVLPCKIHFLRDAIINRALKCAINTWVS